MADSPALTLASLIKLRLGLLVLLSTGTGFYLAKGSLPGLVITLTGTGMVCAGAAALNEALEAKWDRLMVRTQGRPVANGLVSPAMAFGLGSAFSLGGLAVLALGINSLAAALAALALLIYLAVYTPLKRRTPGCVLVGAVAGALPPVIGVAAAAGQIGELGGFLFALLYVWQMPHLLAIAWMHREDYAAAGFAIPGRVSGLALTSSILLGVISSAPLWAAGELPVTGVGILFPNALLIGCATAFFAGRSRKSARRLFIASLVYLPWILGLLLCSRGSSR